MTSKNKQDSTPQGQRQPDNATGVAYATHEAATTDSTTSTITNSQDGVSQNNGNSNGGGNNKQTDDAEYVHETSPECVFSSYSQASTIPTDWLLLDNQSTVDIIHDKKLLKTFTPPTSQSPFKATLELVN